MGTIGDKVRGLFRREPTVVVHLMIKGHIGPGWYDVDEKLRVPVGTTLNGLIEIAGDKRIPLAEALEQSPHLAHTLMLNGERTPVAENGDRVMQDGDSVYLLAPLAGG